MRAIAVDDDQLILDLMKELLMMTGRISEVTTFTNPVEARDWLRHNDADLAFLDYYMAEMDGMELARYIRENKPQCAVIMASSEDCFIKEAYQLHIPGYIQKPFSFEQINSLLEDLTGLFEKKSSEDVQKPREYSLRVECFGQFEVFDRNNQPVKFDRRKAKEMFAYLVYSNGKTFTLKEIDALIFGDEEYSSSRDDNLRNMVKSIKRALKSVDAEDALYREGKHIGVVPGAIKCDYYDVLNGVCKIPTTYGDEFMSQYSWTEGVMENLKRKSEE